MTEKEALARAGIESSIKTLEKYEEFATFSGEQDMQKSALEAIEAFKIILSAVQKQIPEKPNDKEPTCNGWFGYCPHCNKIVSDKEDRSFCSSCGQALDWSCNDA